MDHTTPTAPCENCRRRFDNLVMVMLTDPGDGRKTHVYLCEECAASPFTEQIAGEALAVFKRRSGGHEGFVAALERSQDDEWRELTAKVDGDRDVVLVDAMAGYCIQVGCVCGWRSRYFIAPKGAVWEARSDVRLPKFYDDQAAEIWEGHVVGPESGHGAYLHERQMSEWPS